MAALRAGQILPDQKIAVEIHRQLSVAFAIHLKVLSVDITEEALEGRRSWQDDPKEFLSKFFGMTLGVVTLRTAVSQHHAILLRRGTILLVDGERGESPERVVHAYQPCQRPVLRADQDMFPL
jgi:hypothetical protein